MDTISGFFLHRTHVNSGAKFKHNQPRHGEKNFREKGGRQRGFPVDECAEDHNAVTHLVLTILLFDVATPTIIVFSILYGFLDSNEIQT